MTLIEKIIQFNNKIEIMEVYIEEWNETIYLKPLTIAEQYKITRLSPNNKDLEVNILIEKALDKNCNKLFTLDDKEELRKIPLNLINKILSPILISINKTPEEIEKN